MVEPDEGVGDDLTDGVADEGVGDGERDVPDELAGPDCGAAVHAVSTATVVANRRDLTRPA